MIKPMPKPISLLTEPTWIVKRHAGHTHAIWKQVFQGSESQARERFWQIWAGIRQGSVALYRPDGSMALKESAPTGSTKTRSQLSEQCR
jgi:hypothetical protein